MGVAHERDIHIVGPVPNYLSFWEFLREMVHDNIGMEGIGSSPISPCSNFLKWGFILKAKHTDKFFHKTNE